MGAHEVTTHTHRYTQRYIQAHLDTLTQSQTHTHTHAQLATTLLVVQTTDARREFTQ